MVARAAEFSGLAATGALDRTAQAGGQSTAPAVTLGAATTQADELLVAAVGQDISASGATAFSPGTNGTANVCASTGTTTYSALPGVDGVDIFLYPLYCVVAATGTYGASATFDTATPWSAVLATYRGTP